jgi:hypothetical protein
VATPPPAVAANAHAALSSIFQQPAKARATMPAPTPAPAPVPPQIFAPQAAAPAAAAPAPAPIARPAAIPAAAAPASTSADVQKLRFEILRLESLVKKLQSDLASERDYSRALEEHVKTLQEND